MVPTPTTQIRFCRWNCKPPNCGAGTVFASGCFSVEGPVVCPDGFEFTSSEIYGPACCPQTAAACEPDPAAYNECQDTIGASWDAAACECDYGTGGRDGCPGTGSEWEECNSPVLVDVAGDGFRLTDAAGGVLFDRDGDGRRTRLAWTAAGSDDAWLALDRDDDGRIGNGRELFGDHTPQPPSPAPNGFLALSEFDRPARGGNADGSIDERDAVFASLRLWRDADHDGLSGPGELYALEALDVVRLHLDYKESKRADEHGNRFRYRAKVDDAKGSKVNRWAWDVFLISTQ
jgi:hypothetical protein